MLRAKHDASSCSNIICLTTSGIFLICLCVVCFKIIKPLCWPPYSGYNIRPKQPWICVIFMKHHKVNKPHVTVTAYATRWRLVFSHLTLFGTKSYLFRHSIHLRYKKTRRYNLRCFFLVPLKGWKKNCG